MTALDAALVGVARTGPLVALAPPLGRSWLARAIVCALLTAVVWPALQTASGNLPQGSGDLPQLAILILRELLVGATLGLIVAVPFRAAEAAGALLDDAVALAQPGVPRAPRRIFADAYALLALALFAALSGPRAIAAGLAASYRALPVGATLSAEHGAATAIDAGARLIGSAAALAAPALAALLLADVACALIVRAQPALANALGAPPVRLVVTVGTVAVAAAAAAALLVQAGALGGVERAIADAVRALAP